MLRASQQNKIVSQSEEVSKSKIKSWTLQIFVILNFET